MSHSNITDLTIDELKELIREVVTQTIVELFADPDEGLELREDMKVELRRSISSVQAGEGTIAAREVAEALGLDW